MSGSGFRNALNAGRELVQDVFQSVGYVVGNSGWGLYRNGDAEFNAITARGSLVADGLNVSQILRQMLANSNNTAFTPLAVNTTAAAIPGVQLLGNTDLYGPMQARLAGVLGALDQTTFSVALSVNVDFQSTSTTGSGGHIQLRYKDSNGVINSGIFQVRSGQDDGHKIASWTWTDQWSAAGLTQAFANDVTLGSLLTRHTGSTAYLINGLDITTTWTLA